MELGRTLGRDGQRRRTQREEIIHTAVRIMSHKGYSGTSIQEIADAVGIHKTTIFHYFANKEELLKECLILPLPALILSIDNILKSDTLAPSDALHEVIHTHIAWLTRNLGVFELYNRELKQLSPVLRKSYLRSRKLYESRMTEVVEKLQQCESSTLFKDLDAKMVAYGILGMCNWLGKWYRPKGRLTLEQIAEVFHRMLIHGECRPARCCPRTITKT